MSKDCAAIIEAAFTDINSINPQTKGEVADAINTAIEMLDSGTARVAEPDGKTWRVNAWLKKAILLYFRLHPNQLMAGDGFKAYDKIPLKCANWQVADYEKAGFRAVPGSIVRYGSFVDKGAILMPSFINIGAHIGAGTMVDTWVAVGSCAQIGKNVHLSGGVGIGGVLEPLQASPVIIEDGCFIGARSEVAEGVIVRKGAVLSMGVYLSQSTKIIDRQTGEVFYGEVPEGAVVVSGTSGGDITPDGRSAPALYAAIIVKRVDEKTRAKTSINELLRP